ncbi:MAG: hypothetical protein RI907_3295 [Pseudomonadota bacterium]|jgi:uncharacterized protein YfaP (DUF2135 family)
MSTLTSTLASTLRPLALALATSLTLAAWPALAQTARVQLEHPQGGWRADARGNGFMQEVNYPASRVSVRDGVSTASQIRGQIQGAPKAGGRAAKAPAQLVVNGVPMPLETAEDGSFARPYAFASGSNSVQVRSADGQATQRVQFLDTGSAQRAKLRVVLNWDSPGTDLDLHVVDPQGEHCFYANRVIAGGGALDVDVTTGYGPEIFATPAPRRGVWQVYVNFFGGWGGGEGAQPVTLTVAQVTVITDEGTPNETRRMQRVPLRARGDLQSVLSFTVR